MVTWYDRADLQKRCLYFSFGTFASMIGLAKAWAVAFQTVSLDGDLNHFHYTHAYWLIHFNNGLVWRKKCVYIWCICVCPACKYLTLHTFMCKLWSPMTLKLKSSSQQEFRWNPWWACLCRLGTIEASSQNCRGVPSHCWWLTHWRMLRKLQYRC